THSELPCGGFFQKWSRKNAKCVYETWKALEGSGSGDQFDDLLVVVHTLQFPVEIVVDVAGGMMQSIRAAQAQFFNFGERAFFKIGFGCRDLLVAGALLPGGERMRRHRVRGVQ